MLFTYARTSLCRQPYPSCAQDDLPSRSEVLFPDREGRSFVEAAPIPLEKLLHDTDDLLWRSEVGGSTKVHHGTG